MLFAVQTLAPTCMKYDALSHQFIYNRRLGTKGSGSETITVTVTYPNTAATTKKSESITITK